MKSFITLVAIALFSSSVLASDCVGNSCRQPLRSTVSKVPDVARTIVSAPTKAVRNVTQNIKARRYARQYR